MFLGDKSLLIEYIMSYSITNSCCRTYMVDFVGHQQVGRLGEQTAVIGPGTRFKKNVRFFRTTNAESNAESDRAFAICLTTIDLPNINIMPDTRLTAWHARTSLCKWPYTRPRYVYYIYFSSRKSS